MPRRCLSSTLEEPPNLHKKGSTGGATRVERRRRFYLSSIVERLADRFNAQGVGPTRSGPGRPVAGPLHHPGGKILALAPSLSDFNSSQPVSRPAASPRRKAPFRTSEPFHWRSPPSAVMARVKVEDGPGLRPPRVASSRPEDAPHRSTAEPSPRESTAALRRREITADAELHRRPLEGVGESALFVLARVDRRAEAAASHLVSVTPSGSRRVRRQTIAFSIGS